MPPEKLSDRRVTLQLAGLSLNDKLAIKNAAAREGITVTEYLVRCHKAYK